MKKLLILVAVAALAAPAGAAAHPLGNFTVNRFSAVQLSGEDVFVHYVLDLAEIPTYQEGAKVRSAAFTEEVARHLVLEVDGTRVVLVPVKRRLSTKRGAGGLPTLRFEAVFGSTNRIAGLTHTASLVFHDTNFGDRIGWKEIVVRADHGASIESSTVPAESTSDELRAYPKDLLRSPLDVSSARVAFRPGSGPGVPPALDGGTAPGRALGGFESLVARGSLSLGVLLLSLLIAAFWGAAHALTPGHGKVIVAGYLVGSRGRPRHAVLLGAIVTVTHTAGVFGLGLVTLLLSRFIVPERLYPWLTVASGLLVVGVGASVFWRRWRHRRGHAYGDAHTHDHHRETPGLLGIGIAAGLLPCPSALVVLLSAIALHRIDFGLALILAFSVGLAATITGIGLVAVLARRAFARFSFQGRLVQALPAFSALVIVAVGIGLTVKSLPEVI
jgi:nickel/cobalt transporter (NicO) family protein